MSGSTAQRVTTTQKATPSFLLSCEAEGESCGTIQCCTENHEGFRCHVWGALVRSAGEPNAGPWKRILRQGRQPV